MRVFVTGATGFVGSAVVKELLDAGHQVLGLARSAAGAEKLIQAGAQVHHGALSDLDSLRSGAAAADGVIHTAFNHDFSKFLENCAEDGRAIGALGDALTGSKRPLLVTSGLAMLAPGRLALETDVIGPGFPRVSEEAADTLVKRGIHASAVRLPPTTHGAGDHGFIPILINLAREKKVAAYIGEGNNRWPAVHRTDAARVYRLALELGAKGGPYHPIAEQGIAFKVIAQTIGRHLGIPVVSMSPEQAEAHFGWFARFAAMDAPASSEHTRSLLNWAPKGPTLLEDLNEAGYF